MSVATAPTQITNSFRPGWSNWRLALLAAVIIIPLSILVLPIDVAFWVSLAAAAAVASTAVVNESLRNFTQSLTSQVWVKCYVAACHAYMGNQEKASGVAAEILRQSPKFSARRLMAMEPYRQAEDQNHFLNGMLKAGLPE